jgi:hypothetical protein
MTYGVPQPSPWCARADHERCPHWVGMTVSGLWRLRPRQEVILCNDACHSRRNCPLAGRRKTARDDWDARCACPGADASRQTFQKIEESRRRSAAILAEVDLSDHPDAEAIERRFHGAFEAHGEPVPPLLPGLSRVMAAGTGPRGTRSARVFGLGARAAADAVRWAWQPGTDADAQDRRSLRGMYASFGALVGVAGLLTTAALRASGWRRLSWMVMALLAWLFTTRIIAVGALVTFLVRHAKSAPPPPGSRTS